MLIFSGIAADNHENTYNFKVKAKSEKEAKTKVKENYKKRKKPIKISKIILEYVEFA